MGAIDSCNQNYRAELASLIWLMTCQNGHCKGSSSCHFFHGERQPTADISRCWTSLERRVCSLMSECVHMCREKGKVCTTIILIHFMLHASDFYFSFLSFQMHEFYCIHTSPLKACLRDVIAEQPQQLSL